MSIAGATCNHCYKKNGKQVSHVLFQVNCSPFLLNVAIDHHMRSYWDVDPQFVDKFLSSIYVDDVSLGSDSVYSTYRSALSELKDLACWSQIQVKEICDQFNLKLDYLAFSASSAGCIASLLLSMARW